MATKRSAKRRKPSDRTARGHFTKDSAARFGQKGGRKRTRSLTRAERSKIARLGGLVRQGIRPRAADRWRPSAA